VVLHFLHRDFDILGELTAAADGASTGIDGGAVADRRSIIMPDRALLDRHIEAIMAMFPYGMRPGW
jgi:hypothetical protein